MGRLLPVVPFREIYDRQYLKMWGPSPFVPFREIYDR